MTERPILSLEELESFDPQAPQGARRRFCCPLCGQGKARDSAHRSLSVEVASGLWVCFRCDAKGKVREKWEEKPFERQGRARQAMRSAFGIPSAPPCEDMAEQGGFSVLATPQVSSDSAKDAEISVVSVIHSWRDSFRGLLPLGGSPGQIYLEGRGLSLLLCLSAKVKWAPSWMGRPAVVFPIYDDGGGLVAAQGRYIDGRENPKVRTLGSKREGVFFSPDFWQQVQRGAPIIITEAPLDALSLARTGYPAVAFCGTQPPTWLHRVCAFRRVLLAFDADEAGDRAADAQTYELESFGARCERLRPDGFKDWNDALKAGCDELSDWLALQILPCKD